MLLIGTADRDEIDAISIIMPFCPELVPVAHSSRYKLLFYIARTRGRMRRAVATGSPTGVEG